MAANNLIHKRFFLMPYGNKEFSNGKEKKRILIFIVHLKSYLFNFEESHAYFINCYYHLFTFHNLKIYIIYLPLDICKS
jgi:hypothetical protein